MEFGLRRVELKRIRMFSPSAPHSLPPTLVAWVIINLSRYFQIYATMTRESFPTKCITACKVVYKLLYKPWALSMGEGDFRPLTAPRTLNRFSWNLKYITISRTRQRMRNFRGLHRRGWSGQKASLTHESFCPVLVSLPRPQVASLDALRPVASQNNWEPLDII